MKTPAFPAKGLTLNASPIEIDDGELTVSTLPYRDHEQLRALRAKYGLTHVFRRTADAIEAVAVASGAPRIDGATDAAIRVKKHLSLAAALIREALLNYLHSLGRTVVDYDPIRFFAAGPGDDLLPRVVPAGVAAPAWLAISVRYELAVRVLYPEGHAPFVVLAVDVGTSTRIMATCATLASEGMPLETLYVGRHAPVTDPRVTPRLKLAGRVRTIDGATLILDDARDDATSIVANEAYLEPRRETAKRCLVHAFQTRSAEVEARLLAAIAEVRTGPTRLQRLAKVVDHLGQQRLMLAPGVSFRIGSLLTRGNPRFPEIATAPRATYIFDAAKQKTATWHDEGLKTHGPYTSKTFTPSTPRVAVICQSRAKGRIEQVVQKFINGIPSKNKDRAPFVQGFARKYALQGCNVEFFTTTDASVAAYDHAVRDVLRAQGDRDRSWDLVLVQIDERFHELSDMANPYLLTKAALLAQQLPVQEFELETVSVPDEQLGYVLNNMALACYAKLNGIPWLIQADPTIAHELVFGIGSAEIGTGRLGNRQRTVGITTVFSGDGSYRLTNLSRAVPFAEYQDAILASLRTTIENVRTSFNWQKGDHLRLVFHAFKDFKNVEAEAVKAAVSDLIDFDVEFAFVHVADHHPYVLFDPSQPGLPDHRGGGLKGTYAPTRGQYLRLSGREVLISLLGPRDVKLSTHGLPRPVLLKLHRESTFDDMTYLARQVYTFASHSWRSFFPARLPVTVLYSELVAGLLTKLAAVDSSVTNAMLGRIGKTRWFL